MVQPMKARSNDDDDLAIVKARSNDDDGDDSASEGKIK